jgi:hypothetical protein
MLGYFFYKSLATVIFFAQRKVSKKVLGPGNEWKEKDTYVADREVLESECFRLWARRARATTTSVFLNW